MSDYTPTTEGIALVYVNAHPYTPTRAAERFDRWLAAHDTEVYKRGREDAAKAVEAACRMWQCSREELAHYTDAARGDGGPTVIRSPAVEKLENFKPLFADTQYGRIYFKGSCTHSRTQYTREVCWCGDAVDACDDCGIDVHECGLDGEK